MRVFFFVKYDGNFSKLPGCDWKYALKKNDPALDLFSLKSPLDKCPSTTTKAPGESTTTKVPGESTTTEAPVQPNSTGFEIEFYLLVIVGAPTIIFVFFILIRQELDYCKNDLERGPDYRPLIPVTNSVTPNDRIYE